MTDRNIPTDSKTLLNRLEWAIRGDFDLAHMPALLGEAALEIRRLRDGLTQIAEFNCCPIVDVDPKAYAESETCVECAEIRRRPYHLSTFCDAHYRSILVDRERRQADAETTVRFQMKGIAKGTLRGEALPALEKTP